MSLGEFRRILQCILVENLENKPSLTPCFGVKPTDLNYNAVGSGGQTGLQHITDRHIIDNDPAYKDKRKYGYSPWLAWEFDPQKTASKDPGSRARLS